MAFEIIFQVLFVLAGAVIIGEIFEQIGLPSVAGELLAGMLLGPTVFGIIVSNQQTQAISSISLFFIIFLIGFEMNTETVRKHIPHALLVSSTSFFIPLILALIVSFLLLPFSYVSDFIFALAIAVPSISIISVLVMQFDLLSKPSGQIILSSVAITDTLAFILLAAASRSIENTISVIAYTTIFILAYVLVDWLLNFKPRMFQMFLRRSSRILKREDISYAILIVVGLFVSAIFEVIGISYIIGAFFAGLIVHDGLIGRKAFESVSQTFTRMNRAFFIPLFFGFAGVEASFPAGNYFLLVALAIIIIASIVPAISMTYIGVKRILKMSEDFAPRQIAVILGGRGAVGIVIATVALNYSLIGNTAYSLIILGTLAVSIVVPILLKRK